MGVESTAEYDELVSVGWMQGLISLYLVSAACTQ